MDVDWILYILSQILNIFYCVVAIAVIFKRQTIQDYVIDLAYKQWYREKKEQAKLWWNGGKEWVKKKWVGLIGKIHPEPYVLLNNVPTRPKPLKITDLKTSKLILPPIEEEENFVLVEENENLNEWTVIKNKSVSL